jgi:hypothetical protein
MKIRIKILAIFCITSLLAACGGGDSNSLCGDKSIYPSISFSQMIYTVSVNKPAEIIASVSPQSCRTSMDYAIDDGSSSGTASGNFSGLLPPGMMFGNGIVTGTPTKVGKYTFRLYIKAVKNYEPYPSIFSYPRTNAITIDVIP